SSVSCDGSAASRLRSNPRASRSGVSSSKSQRARRVRPLAAAYALTTWVEATMGLAWGCPGTAMPYSTSLPWTRRTVIRPIYGSPVHALEHPRQDLLLLADLLGRPVAAGCRRIGEDLVRLVQHLERHLGRQGVRH